MTSKEIVRIIVGQIFAHKLLPNDQLPSEAQISIKYKVSRIVATKAYNTLKQIGAIYSIPKKGFFITENFSGIIRSLDDKYATTKMEDEVIELPNPEVDDHRIIQGKFFTFKRKHYKNNQLIIESNNWLNLHNQKYIPNIDLISELIWSDQLTNSIIFLQQETFRAFGNDKNLVMTTIFYTPKGIGFIQKAVIKEEYFKLTKNEWAI